MAGSGTTLVAARLKGHNAIGFDTDPLAILMARVWSADIDANAARARFEVVIRETRRIYRKISPQKAFPAGIDQQTKEFITFWFDKVNRRQLTALANSISRVADKDLRELFWCAFSRMIITKEVGVSLAMDVSHSRPHKKFHRAPIRAFDTIQRQVEIILKNAPFQNYSSLPRASVSRGDARELPLKANSVDLVITSPPYLNAIDYLRGHKLALVWMGFSLEEIRSIRSTNIGTEASLQGKYDRYVSDVIKEVGSGAGLSPRIYHILARYIADMDAVLSETSRVLHKEGKAVFVVGNSALRGAFIKNSKAIAALGRRNGLMLVSARRRPIPENRRYLPSPTFQKSGKALRKRMREEVILIFKPKKQITQNSLPNPRYSAILRGCV